MNDEGQLVTTAGDPAMPADLVTGDDVDNVAAYVASVAGVPGAKPPPPPGGGQAADGKSIFTTNCAGCHTLADAGTTGTVGPNLDQAQPPKELVVDRVTNGAGVMPPFKGTLSDAADPGRRRLRLRLRRQLAGGKPCAFCINARGSSSTDVLEQAR